MTHPDPARAPHVEDPARRLRSGAWLLQRSWRHPQGLPAGWRSERFAASVDRTRRQLQPIRSLAALADSYRRESVHHGPPVRTARRDRDRARASLEVAYLTRWIELDGGRELHAWRTICERAG